MDLREARTLALIYAVKAGALLASLLALLPFVLEIANKHLQFAPSTEALVIDVGYVIDVVASFAFFFSLTFFVMFGFLYWRDHRLIKGFLPVLLHAIFPAALVAAAWRWVCRTPQSLSRDELSSFLDLTPRDALEAYAIALGILLFFALGGRANGRKANGR